MVFVKARELPVSHHWEELTCFVLHGALIIYFQKLLFYLIKCSYIHGEVSIILFEKLNGLNLIFEQKLYFSICRNMSDIHTKWVF